MALKDLLSNNWVVFWFTPFGLALKAITLSVFRPDWPTY